MQNENYRNIIEDYIRAYNHLDIDGMLSNMHDDIRFENISNNEITLVTNGITEIRNQAEQAAGIFKRREQRIIDFQFEPDQVEVKIKFHGELAVDLPNGLKAGEQIELDGKSVFRFKQNKIIELKDYS